MSKVTFTYFGGKTRDMARAHASILEKLGRGTYETRDMIAVQPKPDVDSAGVLWTAEFHVASKLKNKDGTWRKKPGAAAAAESESE